MCVYIERQRQRLCFLLHADRQGRQIRAEASSETYQTLSCLPSPVAAIRSEVTQVCVRCQRTASMSYFIVYVAALMLLTGMVGLVLVYWYKNTYIASISSGTAATNHTFTSSGEMNIASCPITYYGQTYDKVYVAFNANKFTVCFKGLYQPGKENDCIVMSGGTADRGDLSVLTKDIPTGSGVHKLLPNLKYGGKCVNIIPLKDSQQSQVADSQVNGLTVSKQSFQTNETNNGVITDVSGCRLSGTAYKTNTTVRDPNICSTVTCDVSGVASAISDCGPMERCQGNGSCKTQYDDDDNGTINCNTTTEWCDILKQASFIACNKHVNPEPFITACTRTLCKYPAVDGLKCQFLEAYARACSHHSNVTVDSWRSRTSCCFAVLMSSVVTVSIMGNLVVSVGPFLPLSTDQAILLVNGSQIIYKNSIMTRNISMSGFINRHDRVHIDFSCHYRQPETKNLAIRIKDSSVTQQIISGEWYYNLSMNAYTNPERTEPIQPDTYIELNKKIWVELKTEGLNEEMIQLLTDSCWATDQPLPNGSLRYDLVIKGCPNPTDKTVNVVGNGLGTSNFFSFNLFQFAGKTTTDIYFHCKVELCVRDGNTCAPSVPERYNATYVHRIGRVAVAELSTVYRWDIVTLWRDLCRYAVVSASCGHPTGCGVLVCVLDTSWMRSGKAATDHRPRGATKDPLLPRSDCTCTRTLTAAAAGTERHQTAILIGAPLV
ncbi:Pancreatic secretory granule membrane major glycoprotein GP2 [Collichthys lucidus]|uniref:Pancreatic secretory granule membrane major glycoprotein GP2 n=1 Tax=Collichthys lucidus TaxID=240159 RepID=A0A4U5U193_COLLU|nr:Pancreatic secretory granule membrane major glycoprotein GP2 [Collichthys lucidus]